MFEYFDWRVISTLPPLRGGESAFSKHSYFLRMSRQPNFNLVASTMIC